MAPGPVYNTGREGGLCTSLGENGAVYITGRERGLCTSLGAGL